METKELLLWYAVIAITVALCNGQEPPSDDDLEPSLQRQRNLTCGGTWGTWSRWSDCSSSFSCFFRGTGTQSRNRTCQAPRRPRRCRRSDAIIFCDGIRGDITERQSCDGCSNQNGNPNPPGDPRHGRPSTTIQPRGGDDDYDNERTCQTDGTWGSWSRWSDCFCGFSQVTGTQSRNRTCQAPRRSARCRRSYPIIFCDRYQREMTERQRCDGCRNQNGNTNPTRDPPHGRPTFPPREGDEGDDDYNNNGRTCRSENRKGQWGEWGCWSTCDRGRRIRQRVCNRPRPIGFNNGCDEYNGGSSQIESCTNRPQGGRDCEREPLDIVIALDASESVGQYNFTIAKNAVLDLIDKFNTNIGDRSSTHFGILTFSNTANSVKYLFQENFQESRIRYSGAERKDTASAIGRARTSMFGVYGDRPEYDNVLVVITNGQSRDTRRTIREASSAKDDDIRIIAVGVGNDANTSELRQIASEPNRDVLYTSDFNRLSEELNRVFGC